MVYNPLLLLHVCEAPGLIPQLLQIFSDIEQVRTYEGKRVFVLAFAQLLDLNASEKLPDSLKPHIGDIVRALGAQLKKSIDLKKKADEEEFEDESDSDDSEQDIDENEDADSQIQKKLMVRLQEALQDEEEDEDDDDYFDQE